MTLYNIWFNIIDMSTKLVPRVPESCNPPEDTITPRICLSDSVEGCLQAVCYDDKELKSGTQFILHVLDLSAQDTHLIYPIQLKAAGKVPDAEHNHEYWYTKSIECETYLCELISYEYEHTIVWSALKRKDMEELAFKYTYIDMSMCKTTFDIYTRVSRYLERLQMYDLSDEFYEDICKLPWARGFIFKNVKYNILK